MCDNMIAVVTGSPDSIGKAYAKQVAARHKNVVPISRNLARGRSTKRKILSINFKVKMKLILVDFSKKKQYLKQFSFY